MERTMAQIHEVDNSIYELYGDRWYTAYDDPIAFLRAENKVKVPWILQQIEKIFGRKVLVLDVGCGGGFLSNELAGHGHQVTGVDLSIESLRVARNHDKTQSVEYKVADAYKLPYPDASFDVLTAMDFLEHVDCPADVIKEFSRVLKPGGLFFFHTFNRNPLAWLVIIKLLEWFIKNTPKHMHVIRLFIKPKELKTFCRNAQMETLDVVGIRPIFSTITWKMAWTGVVAEGMSFKLTKGTMLSYMGVARKTS
jgi:2-polyprenyl-6-hydroxyphenyl methylase/3-demethylubiquinone-9 3-methyltransferase